MKPIQHLLVFLLFFGLTSSAPGVAVPTDAPQSAEITQESAKIVHTEQCEEKGNGASLNEPASQPEASETTPLESGTRLPITIDTCSTSKTAHIGDLVNAHLCNDLILGNRLVAPKGSRVHGHVSSVQQARKVLKAELSRQRWLKSAGELGVQFDEIITDLNEHFSLVAKPARQARFVKDMNEGRVLGINKQGEIVSPLSSQLKSQGIHWGIHIAVTAAGVAGGPIGLGVMPVAYGCLGAISPSFAFMHPVGKNMKHRRLKGFALGVVSGLPGGGIVCDAIIRGPEAIIEPGDIFEVELQQAFRGEPAIVAQSEQLPVSSETVKGQVLKGDATAATQDSESKVSIEEGSTIP